MEEQRVGAGHQPTDISAHAGERDAISKSCRLDPLTQDRRRRGELPDEQESNLLAAASTAIATPTAKPEFL